MKFGPQSKDEAAIFALEELRADIQYEIMRRMKQLNINQATLAKKIGVSAAWVSQILDDDANLTLESISKVFLALESRCNVSAFPLESTYYEALWETADVNDWQPFELDEIGRYEAADFTSVIHSARKQKIQAPLVQMESEANNRDDAVCLEAA